MLVGVAAVAAGGWFIVHTYGAGDHTGLSGTDNGPAPVTAAPTRLFQLTGNGTKTTQSFTVAANWAITYSFDCTNFGQAGNFQIFEDYPNGSIQANQMAMKGSDVSYVHSDPGTHSLTVNSECVWSIIVLDHDG